MNKKIEKGQLFHLLFLLMERSHSIRMYKDSFHETSADDVDMISKHLKNK